MAVIVLPALLAEQAGGRRRFETDASSLGPALRALPVSDLLFDESGGLRPLVNVYVDGEDCRELGRLETPLAGAETVRVVAAVAGG